jgi:hypothetical protein
MPVFNWEDGQGPAVKRGFKYYWAIAIPVTFLVLIFWGLSVWLPWSEWLSKWSRKEKKGAEEFYENDIFEPF